MSIVKPEASLTSLDIISTDAEKILEEIQDKIGALVMIENNPDTGKDGIILQDINGDFIGEIYTGIYHFGNEDRTHIGVEVSEKHRRKGIAVKLTELWQELGNKLKEEEFSRKREKILFFIKVGYIPTSIINDSTGEEIEIHGEVPFELIGNGFSCKLILE